MNDLFIFGNGEIAEIADHYFSSDSEYNVEGFIVNDEFYSEGSFNDRVVLKQSDFLKNYSTDEVCIFIGISYSNLNKNREKTFNFFKSQGYKFATYVSSRADVCDTVEIGAGSFILEGNNLQYKVKLEENVMLWSGNHIGHGSRISSHTYVASHVVISGHCNIGERNFIGVNATFKDYCNVGNDCFIAMDASVSNDLNDGDVVLGAKAKIIPVTEKINRRIKSLYFGSTIA